MQVCDNERNSVTASLLLYYIPDSYTLPNTSIGCNQTMHIFFNSRPSLLDDTPTMSSLSCQIPLSKSDQIIHTETKSQARHNCPLKVLLIHGRLLKPHLKLGTTTAPWRYSWSMVDFLNHIQIDKRWAEFSRIFIFPNFHGNHGHMVTNSVEYFNYRISRKNRRRQNLVCPDSHLKVGVRRSFQVHTANPWFNCFELHTSSPVRLTQQKGGSIGRQQCLKGEQRPKRRTKVSALP